jgi:ComF family protein
MGEFLCDKCYAQLNFLLNDVELHLSPNYLDKTQALLVYDELIKKMIHQYKYNGVRDLGKTFAFWLYQFLPLTETDALTYIPIHKKRFNERGYNQAQIITAELAQLLNKPVLPVLKRTIDREKQALSKNASERAEKAADIFALQGPINDWRQKYPHLMIVDDVITTGSTINQAAKLLKEAGFEKVRAVAVAHGN